MRLERGVLLFTGLVAGEAGGVRPMGALFVADN